jgi:hypothetical protein
MPLIGGGGAGNVAGGSNPSGVGTSLNYLGNHAYAYSGPVVVNNTTITALAFDTNTQYIDSKIQLGGVISNMGSSKQLGLIISFDGQEVSRNIHMTNAGFAINDLDPIYLIIPPYTKVTVEIITDNAGDISYFATLTGRVYG